MSELLSPHQMETLHQKIGTLWQHVQKEDPAAIFFLDKAAREFEFQLRIYNRNQLEPLLLPPTFPINFGSEKTELFVTFMVAKERELKQKGANIPDSELAIKNHLQQYSGVLKALRIVDQSHIKSFVKPQQFEALIAPFCNRDVFVQIYGAENVTLLEETLKNREGNTLHLIVDDLQFSGFTQVLLRSVLTTLNSTNKYGFFEMFDENSLKQFTGDGLYLPWTQSGNELYQSAQLIQEPKDARTFLSQLTTNKVQRTRAVQFRSEIRNYFRNKAE